MSVDFGYFRRKLDKRYLIDTYLTLEGRIHQHIRKDEMQLSPV